MSLALANDGDSSTSYRWLSFYNTFVNIHLVRLEDGWECDYSGAEIEYIIDTTALDTLSPGEWTFHIYQEFPEPSTTEMEIVCDSPRRGWRRREKGSYRAELRYIYDWWGRATCSESKFLRDTVFFVVAEEGPEDIRAFEAFLAAYCLPDKERANSFWKVMQNNPNSEYRRLAAHYLASSQCKGESPKLPRGISASNLLRALALEIPHDPTLLSTFDCLSSRMGKRESQNLRELIDSLPQALELLRLLEYREGRHTQRH